MSMTIRQREKAYRLQIDNELWDIPNRKETDAVIKTILDLKEKYGRIKQVGGDR